MRNFARIVSLADVDCNVHRKGLTDVEFDFWLQEEDRVFSPTIVVAYQADWFLDILFDGDHEENIKTECENAWAQVQYQLSIHEGLFEGGEDLAFTLDAKSLQMLQPNEDDAIEGEH